MRSACILTLVARLVALAVLMTGAPALPQERGYLLPREQEWLAEHNAARAEVSLGALRWSPALARDAQEWAETLAARRAFQHDPSLPARGQGENLWMGTRDTYAPWQMIDLFIAEQRDFRPGTFPYVSATGQWKDVGHYTQIIWPDTQQVGCATAVNARHEVLVCRYWPAGNVIGTRLEPARRMTRR